MGDAVEPPAHSDARIWSLLWKPAVMSGTPAIEQHAIRYVQPVIGSFFQSPPMRVMSCSWWQAWITEPEPRKRQALKNACVTRWKRPACHAMFEPTPSAVNMKPSCEMVE